GLLHHLPRLPVRGAGPRPFRTGVLPRGRDRLRGLRPAPRPDRAGGQGRHHPARPGARLLRKETGEPLRPFEQARDNMHALVARIAEQPEFRGQWLPFVRGYAVVLPHCNWTGQLPADVQPEMLLGYDALPRLAERIDTLLGLWARRDRIASLDDRSLRGIRSALQSSMQLIPVLAANVADQEECLRRATDEQARVLEYMRAMPRAAFKGVAGSGKTLLALTRTQEFARAGKQTLLVCYNKPLADWMESQFPANLRPNVWVGTFHSLCVEMCKKAGAPLKVRPSEDFWLYEA